MEPDQLLILGLVLFGTILLLWLAFHVFSGSRKEVPVTALEGRVRIKGREDFEGSRVSIGRMKSRDRLSVVIVRDKNGQPFRTETDSRGKYGFTGVPVDNYWIMVERKGYKTMLKLVKLKNVEMNNAGDILME